MNKTNGILLFDGVCNLCNSLVNFVIRRDGERRIKFAALQSAKGQQLLADKGLPVEDCDTVVYISRNGTLIRSAAIISILVDIGGIWKIFYLFKIIPGFILDSLYNFIAKRRYRVFGKRNKCMIPSPDIADRFIE
ncbi:MAG TPA: DCC1-like thiol-disulfide oxidoreductase family protein [Bacteroidales bacterium]|nr:DCC1-like thiol-disulfide oxidoreductase family protein [Bacteroidales bacterium]